MSNETDWTETAFYVYTFIPLATIGSVSNLTVFIIYLLCTTESRHTSTTRIAAWSSSSVDTFLLWLSVFDFWYFLPYYLVAIERCSGFDWCPPLKSWYGYALTMYHIIIFDFAKEICFWSSYIVSCVVVTERIIGDQKRPQQQQIDRGRRPAERRNSIRQSLSATDSVLGLAAIISVTTCLLGTSYIENDDEATRNGDAIYIIGYGRDGSNKWHIFFHLTLMLLIVVVPSAMVFAIYLSQEKSSHFKLLRCGIIVILFKSIAAFLNTFEWFMAYGTIEIFIGFPSNRKLIRDITNLFAMLGTLLSLVLQGMFNAYFRHSIDAFIGLCFRRRRSLTVDVNTT